jgi:hypothetical protein
VSRSGHFLDLTGKRFGRLTAISRVPTKRQGTYWLCRCDCGKEKTIFIGSLRGGATRSCGCKQAEAARKSFCKKPYESLYNHLVRSQSKNLEHSLTFEEFLEFTKITECHYCGEAVTWTKYNLHWNTARYNLDRKDNYFGYSKKNCVVCCKRCNRAKSDSFTYREWRRIGKVIREMRCA